ncbi:GNAT family N-acetyltransferase [Streptomyces sp. MZ04]|uniref:GNAT family N-acetyltransferase n=1 Tax=Streptomyces sp. MZ04 TaxID=2559236 RepID=UPI00107E8D73|nr:GNAT family N-acetyltransferase [Streptomyces sp. MZ04]
MSDAIMRLAAEANPGDPEAFEGARLNLAMPQAGPLSHSRALSMLAEDSAGRPVGVLMGGAPLWLFEHPGVTDDALLEELITRIGIISAVAVDPGSRGVGVGAELIRHAVRRFTRAGYGLLTLNCFPALENYYQRLGFSIMDTLNVNLNTGRTLGQQWNDTRVAARALDRYTDLATVPGLVSPVVSGILPGSRVPRGAYFDGERLRS